MFVMSLLVLHVLPTYIFLVKCPCLDFWAKSASKQTAGLLYARKQMSDITCSGSLPSDANQSNHYVKTTVLIFD